MTDEGSRGTGVRAGALSTLDRAILDLEQSPPATPGQKEALIRRELGLGVARYQQLLNSLIDRPAALAYAPLVVGRLQRLRDQRARARADRSFGPTPR
ncbi:MULTISPECIES: DUF3263 domain-containing protein [Frigoribacterium]|uniref:DUF3263 domain-containing protein n=1 Tax=Frigoribacterium TaxID=96492 RepID=UPI000B24A831|nr:MULTISPECIES: DUF3263 domain-containing protein [unclassified Frigoribacterium]MBD8660428.1 DUF3263 domain-containing protein [Frigoribacterium sp. CFBP 8754]MBD8726777.1 DUF3263 domain-containing protein [Frigoribacterium sp. CFBP 13707]NII51656.1 hypothetical protein [Frigoribacterium endophyticum]QNE43471.1 DUF3263 domain-containing protein [Frigoribacterium sp. NBH87]